MRNLVDLCVTIDDAISATFLYFYYGNRICPGCLGKFYAIVPNDLIMHPHLYLSRLHNILPTETICKKLFNALRG